LGEHRDPEVLTTQWVRNLAELAFLPAYALADESLNWTADGDHAFWVQGRAGGQEAEVRFEVDSQGDVVRASSPSRPYDVPGGYATAPWHYQFLSYAGFQGIRIPVEAVATYDKPEGPWEYLSLRVTSIVFEGSAI
jgi:hypothetical protein